MDASLRWHDGEWKVRLPFSFDGFGLDDQFARDYRLVIESEIANLNS